MKNERSVLCQFRTGIVPLRVETGRYINEALEDRLRRFCTDSVLEDETHFLLKCTMYSPIRNDIFQGLLNGQDITVLTNEQKLSILLNIHTRKIAKYLVRAYMTRKSHIFI